MIIRLIRKILRTKVIKEIFLTLLEALIIILLYKLIVDGVNISEIKSGVLEWILNR